MNYIRISLLMLGILTSMFTLCMASSLGTLCKLLCQRVAVRAWAQTGGDYNNFFHFFISSFR